MAAPSIFGVGAENSTTGVPSVAWPAGHQAGDVGYLVMQTDTGDTPANPAGWTHLAALDTGAGTTGTCLNVWRKVAASSAEANATISSPGDHAESFIVVVRGADTTTPENASQDDDSGATSGTSITYPTVTTTVPDCLILFLSAAGLDNATPRYNDNLTNANLTGLATADKQAMSGGAGGAIFAGSGVKATAGAIGTTTQTMSIASQWAVAVIAVQPPQSTGDATGSGSPTKALGATGSGTATQKFTGSGSPTKALSASGSGTAAQKFTGTGSPTKALGTSASGVAAQIDGGTGSPTASLSATGSGTAVQQFTGTGAPTKALGTSASGDAANTAPEAGSAIGTGTPTATLTATGDGDATQTGDVATGDGDVTATLGASVTASATQKFTGSGSPTKSLTATAVGDVAVTVFEGPVPTGLSTFASATADRTLDWPAHTEGQVALLLVQTLNRTGAPTVQPTVGAVGTPSNFTSLGAIAGAGAVGSGCKISVYWCRATADDMASITVLDPGDHTIAAMLTFDGCIETGSPFVTIGGTVEGHTSPAGTSHTIGSGTLSTPVDNVLVLTILADDVDISGSNLYMSGWASSGLDNVLEIFELNRSTGLGGGIAVASGQKIRAGNFDAVTVTSSVSTQVAGIVLGLQPPEPPPGSTGSGSPTKTLTATAVGAALSTAGGAVGAPAIRLGATGSGTATRALDVTGSGDVTTSLVATVDADASSTGIGTIEGTGAAVTSLVASGHGLAFSTSPRQPEAPPEQGFGGRSRRSRRILPPEPEPEPPKKKRRRRKKPVEPRPVPEAAELAPLPPAAPAFQPFAIDPMVWAALMAPSAPPTPPVVTPAERAEEEAFLAHLLEVI